MAAPAEATSELRRRAGRFFSDREVRPCGRLAAIASLRPRGGL